MRLRRLMTTGAATGALLLLAGCNDGGVPADEQIQQEDGAELPADPGPADGTDDLGDDMATEDDMATGGTDDMTTDDMTTEPAATAAFQDAQGQEVGTIELRETDGGTEVSVMVSGMDPGFYGLHIHGIGECEPDSADPEDPESTGDFMSAGPHLNPDDVDHPDHAGDLSALLVTEAGEGTLTMVSDRFTIADLQDDDGTAFMVHSDRDNFAHIPERYGQPDQDTLDTGDAGDRLACGVME